MLALRARTVAACNAETVCNGRRSIEFFYHWCITSSTWWQDTHENEKTMHTRPIEMFFFLTFLQFMTSIHVFVQIQCCRNWCHVKGHSTRSQSFSQAHNIWFQCECDEGLENGHHSYWTEWFLFGLLLSTESRKVRQKSPTRANRYVANATRWFTENNRQCGDAAV